MKALEEYLAWAEKNAAQPPDWESIQAAVEELAPILDVFKARLLIHMTRILDELGDVDKLIGELEMTLKLGVR